MQEEVVVPVERTRETEERKTPRRHRVFALRTFILERFPRVTTPGTVVLDVAGGKGDLSWLLWNGDGIDSVVCDPRVCDHSKLQGHALWCHANPVPPATARCTTSDPMTKIKWCRWRDDSEAIFSPPRHLRIHVDDALLSAYAGDEDEWPSFYESAIQRSVQLEPSGHHQPRGHSPDTGGTVMCAIEARKLLCSAQLIVGYHPDQATEACIDLALLLRVPFCVVPCCVFPSLFPERRLQNGKQVKSYDDFISYLVLKYPKARVEKLPFEAGGHGGETAARSTVLYMLHDDYQDEEEIS